MTATGSPVGPATGGSDRRRYLVGSADPALLARVGAALAGDPEVSVVRVLDANGLVIETVAARADRLRAEYGPGLVVEADQELGLS